MSFLEILNETRALMCITNLSTGRTFEVQFNPENFTEQIDVNYSRHVVPGLSHEVLQYIGTKNDKFEMDLFFKADTRDRVVRNLAARRQLQSYCYPKRTTDALIGSGPPRILFVWPQFISLTCVLTGVGFTYSRFSPSGLPLEFTASVKIEEIRQVRLLSEDIEQNGSLRAGLQETALEDIEFLDD